MEKDHIISMLQGENDKNSTPNNTRFCLEFFKEGVESSEADTHTEREGGL